MIFFENVIISVFSKYNVAIMLAYKGICQKYQFHKTKRGLKITITTLTILPPYNIDRSISNEMLRAILVHVCGYIFKALNSLRAV